jgi:hypothetical protein
LARHFFLFLSRSLLAECENYFDWSVVLLNVASKGPGGNSMDIPGMGPGMGPQAGWEGTKFWPQKAHLLAV